MKKPEFAWHTFWSLAIAAVFLGTRSGAAPLDTIGVTLLKQTTTNLNGAGIRVAQAEPPASQSNPPDFEVGPSTVGQPVSLFTYYSSAGSANTFPNALGLESGHANAVAGYFYGMQQPVATNVLHVDNYEALYFYNSIIGATVPPAINGRIVNQSFSFGPLAIGTQQMVDTDYDDYAAQYGTLFVSGVGNGGGVAAPATSYNGIGVGAYGGLTSVGPTIDNGRAKPDVVAPEGVTSYATAQVSGCATLLLQAALRGDGGSDTNSAGDMRTLKALLLNGAVKPANWTNSNTSPLDARYGAGILNIFNSYHQLRGKKNGYIVSGSVPGGDPHPPTGASGTVTDLSGWDFNTASGSMMNDRINHYYFNVTNGLSNATFTATAALVWNKQKNTSSINNLDLFLYNVTSGALVAASTSVVDNVEHIFLTKLPPGRYDLQVLKRAGITPSMNEDYALAFEFFAVPLTIAHEGSNAVLAWPIYPTGFVLESTSNLNPPIAWSTVNAIPVVTNNQNRVVVNATSGNQYFRLRRP